jgi:hypothetical protein
MQKCVALHIDNLTSTSGFFPIYCQLSTRSLGLLLIHPHFCFLSVGQGADGNRTTIIYQNDPRNRYDGGDVAMGMMAGAALGTMMWSPLLFW